MRRSTFVWAFVLVLASAGGVLAAPAQRSTDTTVSWHVLGAAWPSHRP